MIHSGSGTRSISSRAKASREATPTGDDSSMASRRASAWGARRGAPVTRAGRRRLPKRCSLPRRAQRAPTRPRAPQCPLARVLSSAVGAGPPPRRCATRRLAPRGPPTPSTPANPPTPPSVDTPRLCPRPARARRAPRRFLPLLTRRCPPRLRARRRRRRPAPVRAARQQRPRGRLPPRTGMLRRPARPGVRRGCEARPKYLPGFWTRGSSVDTPCAMGRRRAGATAGREAWAFTLGGESAAERRSNVVAVYGSTTPRSTESAVIH